jgi:hypothetical protein
MKAMNPTAPDAIRQQLEEERFLKGETETPSRPSTTHRH